MASSEPGSTAIVDGSDPRLERPCKPVIVGWKRMRLLGRRQCAERQMTARRAPIGTPILGLDRRSAAGPNGKFCAARPLCSSIVVGLVPTVFCRCQASAVRSRANPYSKDGSRREALVALASIRAARGPDVRLFTGGRWPSVREELKPDGLLGAVGDGADFGLCHRPAEDIGAGGPTVDSGGRFNRRGGSRVRCYMTGSGSWSQR